MDGIINVYKEAGFTSHDVVAKLRGILNQKKIGHTGTLDPMATGVLPICCGRATKVCELLSDSDKTYQAVCRLGVVTDTQDITGKILRETPVRNVDREQVIRVVESFRGEGMQIPPMYSALKVGGRRLYQMAREGMEIEREPRRIFISDIKILQMDLEEQIFSMEVTCSKGTYIRTLCHDIGQKLGTGAAMENLVRTRVGNFKIADALTLDMIEQLSKESEKFLKNIYTVDSLFMDYPKYQIKEEYAKKLANGNILKESFLEERQAGQSEKSECLIYDEHGNFKAVYKKTRGDFIVVKMF